ncbi:hypothetical protein [Fibrella aquatilis]|uniref:Uncharacterized protein n=1 Tax=Fibrella aquatilis TaxID=2817059 RepID=A0A939G9V7_9BACT|nr:hypothetical protein [Fibrella aquatilis]MBO0933898.1 hypothetical protein [Fibrella aquatilis]
MTKLDEVIEKLNEAIDLWDEFTEEAEDAGNYEAAFWQKTNALTVRIAATRNDIEEFQEKHLV